MIVFPAVVAREIGRWRKMEFGDEEDGVVMHAFVVLYSVSLVRVSIRPMANRTS